MYLAALTKYQVVMETLKIKKLSTLHLKQLTSRIYTTLTAGFANSAIDRGRSHRGPLHVLENH